MKQILINQEELQTRVAVVEDGKLEDFFIERRDRDRVAGCIYKARIKNLEPSLQAAFVDIGQPKNAFLHYWDIIPATLYVLEGGDDDQDQGDNDQKEKGDNSEGTQSENSSNRSRRSRRGRHRRKPNGQQKPEQNLLNRWSREPTHWMKASR